MAPKLVALAVAPVQGAKDEATDRDGRAALPVCGVKAERSDRTRSQVSTAVPRPKPVAKRSPGRPSGFKPQYTAQATKLCDLGATDEEIASFFSVSVRTLYRWKLDHPEFCQSLKGSKDAADERVERTLYQKALGYDVVEQRPVKVKSGPNVEQVELVEVRRHVPADTTAAIFWLKNRRPSQWREKSHVAVTDHIAALSDEELEQELTQLLNGVSLPSHEI